MDPITNFFASLFEWFGINHLYSKDLGEHLRGYDITCTDYFGTHWYSIIGISMLVITVLCYALQYHILDKFRFNRCRHWWIFLVILFTLNFFIGFVIPFNTIQSGDYCQQLIISTTDCIGFGFSNAVWSFIAYVILTSFKYPRDLANNCRYTTFWKP